MWKSGVELCLGLKSLPWQRPCPSRRLHLQLVGPQWKSLVVEFPSCWLLLLQWSQWILHPSESRWSGVLAVSASPWLQWSPWREVAKVGPQPPLQLQSAMESP